MPRDKLDEAMLIEVVDAKPFAEFRARVAFLQIAAKRGLTMFAQAVVAIEIIDHVAIDAPLDAAFDPGAEHRLPVRVSQAGPVFMHAADPVALLANRGSVGAAFEQFAGVGDRFGSQFPLVPQVFVKLEEAGGAVRAVDVADQEFHIEMPDHFHATLSQLGVAVGEPLPAFGQPADRKVSWITAIRGRVRQAPEMRAVEAKLRDVGLRRLDERQISWIVVRVPMRHHLGELEARPRDRRVGGRSWRVGGCGRRSGRRWRFASGLLPHATRSPNAAQSQQGGKHECDGRGERPEVGRSRTAKSEGGNALHERTFFFLASTNARSVIARSMVQGCVVRESVSQEVMISGSMIHGSMIDGSTRYRGLGAGRADPERARRSRSHERGLRLPSLLNRPPVGSMRRPCAAL